MGEKPAKHETFFSFQNNLRNENKASDFAVEIIHYVKALWKSYSGVNVRNWYGQSGQSRSSMPGAAKGGLLTAGASGSSQKRALSELVFLLTKFLTSHSSTSPPTTHKELELLVVIPHYCYSAGIYPSRNVTFCPLVGPNGVLPNSKHTLWFMLLKYSSLWSNGKSPKM